MERYFEGLTSAEEEKTLRHFFTSGDVPEKLAMYTPLFSYFDAEIKKATTTQARDFSPADLGASEVDMNPSRRRIIFGLWISGAAACAAILVGLFFFNPSSGKCSGNGNYVIIDGRCYTDDATVRAAALRTLREISDDDSELLSENENDKNSNNDDNGQSRKKSSGAADIIQKQLNEFNSFFDEDE